MSRFFLVAVLSALLFCVNGQGLTNNANATANDVLILQYALTLERLEAYFYNTGLSQSTLSQSAFAAAGYNASVYANLNIIAMEEMAHVNLLSTALGSSSVPACTYNFTSAFSSVGNFLATAAALETTGTSAYDSAISGISSSAYATVAATISTVEARHTSYINLIQGINPVPYVTQPTITVPQVVSAIAPFLANGVAGCPYNVASVLGITVRPGGVSLGSNGQVNFTGPIVSGVTYTAAQQQNDLQVLQYALILENLEAAFYNNFIRLYSLSAWTAAGYSAVSYTYLQNITAQENAHVAVISSVISSRGGVPLAACSYNFASITSIPAYVATAYVLENTGVSAYDGAASFITDTALEVVAATIVAVEARHTALISILYNMTAGAQNVPGPFPNVLDYAATPAQVFANVTATGLLGTCPQLANFVLPQQLATTVTSVRGDPQFVGLRGQNYQVHGMDGAVYNLITEPNTQVNSRFVFLTEGVCPAGETVGCWSHPGSYMGEMSFQSVVDGKLHAALITSGSAKKGFSAVQMDGKSLKAGETVSFGAFSITFTSSHSATVTLDNYVLDVSNSDMFVNMALSPKVQLSQLKSHGLIGQTHSTKTYKNSVKYVEGEVDDYSVTDDDVFGTSFPFNLFGSK